MINFMAYELYFDKTYKRKKNVLLQKIQQGNFPFSALRWIEGETTPPQEFKTRSQSLCVASCSLCL